MRLLQDRNMALITQQRCTTCQYATIGLYDVTVKMCSLLYCSHNTHVPEEIPRTVTTFHYSLPTVVCVNSTTSGLW